MFFSNYRLQKTWLDKCLKSPVSEDPSTSDMVNGPKRCFSPRASTFTIFINHCYRNSVGKNLSKGNSNRCIFNEHFEGS